MTAYERLATNLAEAVAIAERCDALVDLVNPDMPAAEREHVAAELLDLRLRLNGVAS